MANSLSALSLLETRVLGTLVEKQRTVPDTYPLSLNSLVAGCNQKTSRNPVLEAGEPEILLAVENLKELGLVSEVSGSRVVRFAHNLEKVLGVPTQASALPSRLSSKSSPPVRTAHWWSSCRVCRGRAKTAGRIC